MLNFSRSGAWKIGDVRVSRATLSIPYIAGWSSPVARWAHNPKVAGSNPAPATNLTISKFELRNSKFYRGCSSVGRAPRLQRGGQGFESPHLHQLAIADFELRIADLKSENHVET